MPSLTKQLARAGSKSEVNRLRKQIERFKSGVKQTKAAAQASTGEVIGAGERVGCLALASAAEGYYGSRIKLAGKVDARPALGIPAYALGVGLGMSRTSSSRAAGKHLRAISEGVVGSWVASQASAYGARHAGGFASAPSIATPSLPVSGDGEIGAMLRDILVDDPRSAASGPLPRSRRNRGRFAHPVPARNRSW